MEKKKTMIGEEEILRSTEKRQSIRFRWKLRTKELSWNSIPFCLVDIIGISVKLEKFT